MVINAQLERVGLIIQSVGAFLQRRSGVTGVTKHKDQGSFNHFPLIVHRLALRMHLGFWHESRI